MVGRKDKARVVRSQTCGEHARTPRPPRRLRILGRTASAPPLVLQNVDVPARVDCLFLTRIRDLRDRMHAFARFPVIWRPDAAVVAVTDGEEDTITPHSASACLNLQILVYDDPSTTAWTLLAEGSFGMKQFGSLHFDAQLRHPLDSSAPMVP